jgi:predicted regulator of Ras-like GTPase activity (Roadblock/LC7/MglB family)
VEYVLFVSFVLLLLAFSFPKGFAKGDGLIEKILQDLIASVPGAKAVIFLDGDGETIVQAGEAVADIKLLGAWKEIHFDHIKEITQRLGLGSVQAVLFSLDEGNELIVPVAGDYCLLLFLSAFASPLEAMTHLKKAVELLRKDIE